MARLAGVDLPREKRMEIALTYIYGIGKTTPRRPWPRRASAPTCASRTSATRTC